MNLRTFGSAFEIFSSQDRQERMSTGAFDYLRDGAVDKVGWVADVMKLKVGIPGNMLCPTNRNTINEKVLDYAGVGATASFNPKVWPALPTAIRTVGKESKEFWAAGYNTNYATTWQFSRGDLADEAVGVNKKWPQDGTSALSKGDLTFCSVSASRIAVMGDSRVGDGGEATVTSAWATALNDFAGKTICHAGDFTVESFTDGPSVDYSTFVGSTGSLYKDAAGTKTRGHEFNDIQPLHSAKNVNGKLVGGYANILFADGHVSAVYDTGGKGTDVVATATSSGADGFIGPYKTDDAVGAFTLNQEAFDEISETIYYGKIRTGQSPGGGVEN
jgi:prepilin-type processing-associated H-X9-DG protein